MAQVRVLNDDLASASRRANALLAAYSVEREDTSLADSLTSLHNTLQGRTLELSALRRKHASIVSELVELRRDSKHLKGLSRQTLADNQEFQLHLSQVTDERDRLKAAVDEKAPRHYRLQLKALRDEVEEMRFKLKIANRAIVELEGTLNVLRAGERAASEITAPMLRPVSGNAYTAN
ncbi:MAG: hypothetical protein GY913_27980 [Proteobacteria bacterium]|nr:hypothetical protein [Pseudomonadota bacterium]MCP4920750.1 hypothetical protein [Pseudomonadota bacterium]